MKIKLPIRKSRSAMERAARYLWKTVLGRSRLELVRMARAVRFPAKVRNKDCRKNNRTLCLSCHRTGSFSGCVKQTFPSARVSSSGTRVSCSVARGAGATVIALHCTALHWVDWCTALHWTHRAEIILDSKGSMYVMARDWRHVPATGPSLHFPSSLGPHIYAPDGPPIGKERRGMGPGRKENTV
jgi:hypothetical protein